MTAMTYTSSDRLPLQGTTNPTRSSAERHAVSGIGTAAVHDVPWRVLCAFVR